MAKTYLSPEVVITETDKSQYTVTYGISTGAGVICAESGSCNTPVLIDNEQTLVNIFGRPNDSNYKNWFSIANFLQYTDSCWVVRMATKNQFNANSKGVTGWVTDTIQNSRGETVEVYDENGDPVQTRKGLVINNNQEFTTRFDDSNQNVYGEFAYRYPGSLGNSIMVTYADSSTYDDWIWTDDDGTVHDWRQEFNQSPNTSTYAKTRGCENDEIHLLVIDAGGRISGTKGMVLEKYSFLSKASDGRTGDGLNNNYKKVLRDQSSYVYCMDYPENDKLLQSYNYKVNDVIGYEDKEKLQENIKNKVYKKGELVFDVPTQKVYLITQEYTITDEGLRTKNLVAKEYVDIVDWSGKMVFNTRTRAVGKIEKLVYKADQLPTEIPIRVGNEETVIEPSDVEVLSFIVQKNMDSNWGTSCNTPTKFKSLAEPVYSRLSGGQDDYNYTTADEITAWDKYQNKETYDLGLCITGACNASVAKYVIENICEERMDCVAFVSPSIDGEHGSSPIVGNLSDDDLEEGLTSSDEKILQETLNFRTKASFNINSSYGHLDSGWKYMYDKYNDCNRWIPLNGDIAGLYAAADASANQWSAPAGYARGQVKGVIRLNYSPSKPHRDQLYPNQINPVVTMTGEGTILYGTKSLQSKPSAFDRLPTRRLFIYIEKSLADQSKYLLFENNTATLRSYASQIYGTFLKGVMSDGGIYSYQVVCDSSNNTADVIDANRMVADIYIQPTKYSDWINLNFICLGSGSSSYSEA